MIKQNWMIIASAMLVLGVTSCSKNDGTVDTGESKQTIRPITGSSSAYVDTVFSFLPAPGQFINTDFADIKSVNKITDNKSISLGAWGGQIVLGFDHTVLNREGNDIQIEGLGSEGVAEPGIVWVSYDANGNGQPDDPWYELKGSAFGTAGYERNYKVTYYNPGKGDVSKDVMWVDNHSDTGYVKRNSFHKQSYFPAWITADSLVLEGSKLPDTGIDLSNASMITSVPFEYGYADNHDGSHGGNPIDISNAIDANGTVVKLIGIDFIKIQTGIMKDLGWLGELSTEVTSVGDLSMIK